MLSTLSINLLNVISTPTKKSLHYYNCPIFACEPKEALKNILVKKIKM